MKYCVKSIMNPVVPDKDSIIECDRLPEFEEIEINGSHDVQVEINSV